MLFQLTPDRPQAFSLDMFCPAFSYILMHCHSQKWLILRQLQKVICLIKRQDLQEVHFLVLKETFLLRRAGSGKLSHLGGVSEIVLFKVIQIVGLGKWACLNVPDSISNGETAQEVRFLPFC